MHGGSKACNERQRCLCKTQRAAAAKNRKRTKAQCVGSERGAVAKANRAKAGMRRCAQERRRGSVVAVQKPQRTVTSSMYGVRKRELEKNWGIMVGKEGNGRWE